jgi:hypothetical protein
VVVPEFIPISARVAQGGFGMKGRDLPTRRAGIGRAAGRFVVAVGAMLMLLLAAGCGTAQEEHTGVDKGSTEPGTAWMVATPVPSVAMPVNPTASAVDGTAQTAQRLSAINDASQAHEACRPRVYELVVGVTPHEGADGSRMVACLVLDLGDLSVRTIDLPIP